RTAIVRSRSTRRSRRWRRRSPGENEVPRGIAPRQRRILSWCGRCTSVGAVRSSSPFPGVGDGHEEDGEEVSEEVVQEEQQEVGQEARQKDGGEEDGQEVQQEGRPEEGGEEDGQEVVRQEAHAERGIHGPDAARCAARR